MRITSLDFNEIFVIWIMVKDYRSNDYLINHIVFMQSEMFW